MRSGRVAPSIALSFFVTSSILLFACSNGNRNAESSKTKDKHGLTQEQGDQVLARVAGKTITVRDFVERLEEQSPYLRARFNSLERRREFLDNMVRFELLAAEARRRKIDQLPEVQRARKQLMVQEMVKDLFDDKIHLQDIDEKEMRAFYDTHLDEFHKPAQMRVSQIVVGDHAKAEKILEQLIAQQGDMEFFRSIARKENEDPTTKERVGDVGFISRPSERSPTDPMVPDNVANASFELANIGDVYPKTIKTAKGYVILELTGKRPALERTFDSVRHSIQNRLWREKKEQALEKFVNELRKANDVRENLEILSELDAERDEKKHERPHL